jgi:S-formylglutathione hydrolase
MRTSSSPRSCAPICCKRRAPQAGHPLDLRLQPGYDHSYYFIASFIGEHIAHHARALRV